MLQEKPLTQTFTKTVTLGAPAIKVWNALTDVQLMQQWMSEEQLEIITDWQVGSLIIIKAMAHWVPSESKGTVLRYEPEKELHYTHLSSLSRLPDEPESYTTLAFSLAPIEQQTALTLMLSNFPTESIYKHLAFYWNVTLELLKRFIEEQL